MAIVVKRPKLKWWEQLYLPAIFKGLGITLRHFIATVRGKKKVTMQYPEEKWNDHLPEHYRGAPALVTDEQDRERCVACRKRFPAMTSGPRSKSAPRHSRST